jgi:hypothetical protein
MIEAYPLQWPIGFKRTEARLKTHAAFQTSFAVARDKTIQEIKAFGGTNPIISSNIPLKKDGTPYAVKFGEWKSISDDTGIAVYFTYKNEMKVLCCDAYLCFDDNMQAIRKTFEALRGIERWKVSEMLSRSFTGFKALPGSTEAEMNIWYILKFDSKPATFKELQERYWELAKVRHPDSPCGSEHAFHILNEAFEKAKKFFT